MGFFRGWLIRGLLVGLLAVLGVGGWLVSSWVSPEQVRVALLNTLHERFPEADIDVGSARMRIFGGISVTDLRITRRGEQHPVLETGSAIIFHDKEQLNHGKVLIRKVEIDQPTIRLNKRSDGSWNIVDLVPKDLNQGPVPTIVIRQATILVHDENSDGLPPIRVRHANLTLLNDPQSVLKFDLQGTLVVGDASEGASPFELPFNTTVHLDRPTGSVTAHLGIEKLSITPQLAPVLAKLHPTLGDTLLDLEAELGIKADVQFLPGDCRPLRYDVRLKVRDGTYSDDRLPDPITNLTASIHLKDGWFKVSEGHGRMGVSSLRFELESRTKNEVVPESTLPRRPAFAMVRSQFVGIGLPLLQPTMPMDATQTVEHEPSPFDEMEAELQSIQIRVSDLPLDDQLFAKLPEAGRKARADYRPEGNVDVDYEFSRDKSSWQRTITVRPNQITLAYEKFPYPVVNVTGSIKHLMRPERLDEFRIQLSGTAAQQRVELAGRVVGRGEHPLIDLKLAGTDFPLDDRVFDYLPERFGTGLRNLRAEAQADFVVDIRQQQGEACCDNTFRVKLYRGKINPTNVPYPLRDVQGEILVSMSHGNDFSEVRRTHFELRDFQAWHNGGRFDLSGESDPIPGSFSRKVTLHVKGLDCPLDDDLATALRELGLESIWEELSPEGTIRFWSEIEWIDHEAVPSTVVQVDAADSTSKVVPAMLAHPGEPGFNAEKDLKVTASFDGPSITPAAFPYKLDRLKGKLRYKQGTLDLAEMAAVHDDTRLSLADARLMLYPNGGFYANLGEMEVTALRNDATLRAALPESLGASLLKLGLSGELSVHLKHLVIKQPAATRPEPIAVARNVSVETTPAFATPAPIIFWNGEVRFKQFGADLGGDWQNAYGRVAVVGRHEGDHLGKIVGNVWFDSAMLNGHPVTNIQTAFRIQEQQPDPLDPTRFIPPAVEFSNISANLYQGIVGGEARIVLAEVPRYRLWLTGAGIQLSELTRTLAKSDATQVDGQLQGKILLENRIDPLSGQSMRLGQGQLDIPKGRLLNLPVLLPLLKLLKLQKPDQTAFDEAHALFEIVDDKIIVTQLDLIGNAVSLGGTGEIGMNGEQVHFEFFTIWSQALKKWLTTPLGDVTSFLSGNLFKIDMVRKDGKMVYTPQMLPAVTGPMEAVAERLRDRLQRTRATVFPQPSR